MGGLEPGRDHRAPGRRRHAELRHQVPAGRVLLRGARAAQARPDRADRYVTFRLSFHHFDRLELDLRGHTHVRRSLLLSSLNIGRADMPFLPFFPFFSPVFRHHRRLEKRLRDRDVDAARGDAGRHPRKLRRERHVRRSGAAAAARDPEHAQHLDGGVPQRRAGEVRGVRSKA